MIHQGHTEQAPQVEPRERVVLDGAQIHRALTRIAHEILESDWDPESLYLVAIPNGGVPLGRVLGENIASLSGARPGMGILDTTDRRVDASCVIVSFPYI